METIRKWTSPTQELRVKGVNLVGSDVYVTLEQRDTSITLSGADITVTADGEDTLITIPMSQEMTGGFSTKEFLSVEVNWITDGQRNATEIAQFKITRNLYDQVIEV